MQEFAGHVNSDEQLTHRGSQHSPGAVRPTLFAIPQEDFLNPPSLSETG